MVNNSFTLEGLTRYNVQSRHVVGGLDAISGQVDILHSNPAEGWFVVAEIGTSSDTEVIDPFDEDCCPSASVRRRYYANPDCFTKIHMGIVGVGPEGLAINAKESGRTVGEIAVPIARTIIRVLGEAMNDAEKRFEVVIEDEDEPTIHASLVAELLRLLPVNAKGHVALRNTVSGNSYIEISY
jgi:hypothetical protein